MTINEIIRKSLEEDIQSGDISTENLGLGDQMSKARLICKENGVMAGLEIFSSVFKEIDESVKITFHKHDGERAAKGELLAELFGKAASLLLAERVALNFLQRLSGIATLTAEYVAAIGDNHARLLDTRKTTPLLRQLEKYAVRAGGGFNHRFGLYDMIMLKENHIRAAGSISKAVEQVRNYDTSHKLEVEVTNLTELAEAVAAGVDRVMLDNMALADMRQAVERYQGQVELEASGNVTLATIGAIASTGVDFISSGSLTHSYKSLDISLLFEE
ncbi:MAG: carboxylating nicotinate-nucleotide diphosphorylase [Candidatus Cloacimonetes bacterium]|nr:carboxylating nicotinate-nucleotide diphosphorylase [Candidatus Cloacimonadota bacterium]